MDMPSQEPEIMDKIIERIHETPYPNGLESRWREEERRKDLQRRITYWRDKAIDWYDTVMRADWSAEGALRQRVRTDMGKLAMEISESYRRDAEEAV